MMACAGYHELVPQRKRAGQRVVDALMQFDRMLAAKQQCRHIQHADHGPGQDRKWIR